MVLGGGVTSIVAALGATNTEVWVSLVGLFTNNEFRVVSMAVAMLTRLVQSKCLEASGVIAEVVVSWAKAFDEAAATASRVERVYRDMIDD